MLRKILLVVLATFIVIQFFRPAKNKAEGARPKALSSLYNVPADVTVILDKACNDCHSNNTKYPWYAEIQPVAWWLSNHVKEGKQELNFDEFAGYSLRKQYHKLEETAEMVKENHMPLNSYLWMHKDADLTTGERQKIITWSSDVRKQMEAKYPVDSLIKKNS